jgi:hypothetical protein
MGIMKTRDDVIIEALDKLSEITKNDFHGYRSEIWGIVANAITEAYGFEVVLSSVDFETNELTVILPKEIVARGFHAGKVRIDLSGVQS